VAPAAHEAYKLFQQVLLYAYVWKTQVLVLLDVSSFSPFPIQHPFQGYCLPSWLIEELALWLVDWRWSSNNAISFKCPGLSMSCFYWIRHPESNIQHPESIYIYIYQECGMRNNMKLMTFGSMRFDMCAVCQSSWCSYPFLSRSSLTQSLTNSLIQVPIHSFVHSLIQSLGLAADPLITALMKWSPPFFTNFLCLSVCL